MPHNNWDPTFALASAFDASQWADGSTVLYTRDTQDISLPTAAGVYDDLLDFLNGRGSDKPAARTLQDAFDSAWTGAVGGAAIYIDADDRLVIEHSGEPFTVSASADNAWFGLDTAGASSVVAGATNRVTGSAEWLRTNLDNRRITVDPAGAGAAFTFPGDGYKAVNLPTLLRGYAESDADGAFPTTNLEYLEHDAGVSDDSRWGLTDAGYVYTSWATGGAGGLTWGVTDAAVAFRERLGFTGEETTTTTGNLNVVVAANRPKGFIVPTRPLAQQNRAYDHDTRTARLRGGGAALNRVTEWHEQRIAFKVGGPAAEVDEARHWLDRCLPYMRPGENVTLYQDWPETRRGRADLNRPAADAPYGVLYTGERDGFRGRVRCIRGLSDTGAQVTNWTNDVRLLFEVQMTLEERD